MRLPTMLIAATAISLAGTVAVAADTDITKLRELRFDDIQLERIEVKGRFNTTTIQKICLDGHAYLMLSDESLTAAFKDGKPETCGESPKKSPFAYPST